MRASLNGLLTFLCFQVHYILNELVMGGMVLETNMTEILLRIEEQNKIEKEEVHFLNHSKSLRYYVILFGSVLIPLPCPSFMSTSSAELFAK